MDPPVPRAPFRERRRNASGGDREIADRARKANSEPLDLHPREAGLAKAEHAGGGGRDVDDAPANERPAVDDLHDRAAAFVEI